MYTGIGQDFDWSSLLAKGKEYLDRLQKMQDKKINELIQKYGMQNVLVQEKNPGQGWQRVDNYYDLDNFTISGVWVHATAPISTTKQVVSFLSNPVTIIGVGAVILWLLLK